MIEIGNVAYAPLDKVLEIRDKKGKIKAKYAIGDDAVHVFSLMEADYVEFGFELDCYVCFVRSDYVMLEGKKYVLRQDYKPDEENKYKFVYRLRFDAEHLLLQDASLYYTRQNLREISWTLTSNAANFLGVVAENANRYFGVDDFSVGTVEPKEIKTLSFDKSNCLDALTELAEAFDSEWYFTGRTIHLVSKLSFGTGVDFETDVSIGSIRRSEGEISTHFNRITALGGTRNIPVNYRGTKANETVEAVVQTRLRIPESKGDVIDSKSGMSGVELVEGTVIFDDIYPKRTGSLSSVTTKTYTDTDEESGKKTTWRAYRFKDKNFSFSEDYLLEGEELRLVFESGDLNGLDFALKFNPDGLKDGDANRQVFELVRNEDYGVFLPNDNLKPKTGDKYVLHGFDIGLIADSYVPEAEQELYEKAVEWLESQLKDTSVYDCSTLINYFADKEMDLEAGQQVKLIHKQFEGGFRLSRIMGYEKKLINRFDAIYTVGDNAKYSRLASIEGEVSKMSHSGIFDVYESGGNGVYVIKQHDTTVPTDFNVFSARRTDASYLNRQRGGVVGGDVLFKENVQIEGLGISDVFQNSTFTAGQFGSGFQLKRDANGQSYMELDNLLVRREMLLNRLTVAEIKSVGGSILLSLASLVVLRVVDSGGVYKVYFDTESGTIPNDFAVNDQAICRRFTGKNSTYYWARVSGVGSDFIELSKTDKAGSGIPTAGDELIQLGNRTDVNRQHAILLSAYGSDAPSIKQYSGINSFDLTGREVTVISPKGNKFKGDFEISRNGASSPIYRDVGRFVQGRYYYLRDRVSYLGSYWICVTEKTTARPAETSTHWRKETAGDADISAAVDAKAPGTKKIIDATGLDHNMYYPVLMQIPQSSTRLKISRPLNSSYGSPSWGKNHPADKRGFSCHCEWISNGSAWGSAIIDRQILSYQRNWLKPGIEPIGSIGQLSYSSYEFIYVRGGSKYMCEVIGVNNAIIKIVATTYTINNQTISPRTAVSAIKVTSKKLADGVQENLNVFKSETSSKFLVLDDRISAKVSQSDFNVLGNRVSSAEGSIVQNANKITLEVEKATHTAMCRVRYIRDWLNGSNANGGNHWVEIQAWRNGANVAKGKPCMENLPNKSRLTDGSIDSGYVERGGDSKTYVRVDLGAVMAVDFVKIWHYYGNGRIYYGTKTEVSADGVNWISVFDSSVEGTYKETLEGRKYWVNPYAKDSALRSKINQTSDSIALLVEKTAIDKLGNGETLFSKIGQKADEISLEVNKIRQGVSSYTLFAKDRVFYYRPGDNKYVSDGEAEGGIALRVWRGWGSYLYCHTALKFLKPGAKYRIYLRAKYKGTKGKDGIRVGMYLQGKVNFSMDLVKAGITSDYQLLNCGAFTVDWGVNDNPYMWFLGSSAFSPPVDSNGNGLYVDYIRFSEAEGEDRSVEQVASSLTIAGNKISLASKTIELKGTTIADAIKAGDLQVGSKTTNSELRVERDGTFYSRGTKGDYSLIIDSDNQIIELKSKKIEANGGDKTGVSTLKMSGASGGFSTRGSTAVSGNSVAILSAGGVFANTALQRVTAPSTGILANASIVGLGWGNVAKNYSDTSFVAGVYGSSSNTGTAKHYGGYFEKLRANGLYLNVRNTGNTNVQLNEYDCFVHCYNHHNPIEVALPKNPYPGQVLFIRKYSGHDIAIRTKDGKAIYKHVNHGYEVWCKGGSGMMALLVFDGSIWGFNWIGL